jgi:hypothetical protein
MNAPRNSGNCNVLHHDYYTQFITTETLDFVRADIGLEKLFASECENLNDVVEWEQGGRTWLWDRTPINTAILARAGESDTRSTRTCVGKAAARILTEEHRKNA